MQLSCSTVSHSIKLSWSSSQPCGFCPLFLWLSRPGGLPVTWRWASVDGPWLLGGFHVPWDHTSISPLLYCPGMPVYHLVRPHQALSASVPSIPFSFLWNLATSLNGILCGMWATGPPALRSCMFMWDFALSLGLSPEQRALNLFVHDPLTSKAEVAS